MNQFHRFNQKSQLILSFEKPILYLSVALLAVITISPLLDVGFTTNDDTLKGLWEHGNYWEQGFETAKYQGRFTHFTSIWLKLIPYRFGIDSWFYKLSTFGMFFIACLAFGYSLKFFSKSNNTGLLGLIFVFAFIQNSWDHNLLTSYPFYYNLRFAMLMIAMVIFYKAMERESKILLYVFAFTWFFVITEGFLQYVPIFIILILVNYYEKNKISITGVIAFSIPVVIFFIIYIIFRSFFPSYYHGNILTQFNLI